MAFNKQAALGLSHGRVQQIRPMREASHYSCSAGSFATRPAAAGLRGVDSRIGSVDDLLDHQRFAILRNFLFRGRR